ncbi:MAG TPA: AAA family ATPase [Actinomycetota bacterium]|nr:AAA family ATPase [Actinomycetota bacterium]
MRLGEAPAQPPGLPEGIVTFLLTDIEGSTPLWETHRAAMSTALARHEALIAEAVASHGGQLIKSRGEGDSTLSVFVRATDAVAAALAVQQALATERWPDDITLPTRVALHSGEAELRDGDYYGQTLNRAARLRALAHGGHVLLSQGTAEIVMDQLPPETSLADVGKHRLKGLSRPEHVFALVHPDLGPPPRLPTVPSAPSEAAFVGRRDELARLDAALDGVLAGTAASGLVALVAGEAGIGKSALVKRFTERHAADARFLVGACDPLLTPRALGPLHDIARQTGGRLAELLAAASPREQLFAALLDELDQPARPQVVVVEDAHWADEATLDLLVFLGRRMEQAKALLIVTYRDDELAVDHPLLAVISNLPQEAVRRLPLQPLSEAAMAELARLAGRPAAGLHALTGGNPLLVTEMLAAGEPGVPATIRDLVLARLAGLPAEAQKVVRLVAVVPTRTELWLLEETLRPEPAAVERCAEAGLLVIEEEAVGFRHELLRQAVEGSISALGRRSLHRRVLQVLSDTQGRGGRHRPAGAPRPAGRRCRRRAALRARGRPPGDGGRRPPGGRRALPGSAAACRPALPSGAGRAAGGVLGGVLPVGAVGRCGLRPSGRPGPPGGRRRPGAGGRGATVAVARVLVGRPPEGGGGGRRPRDRRAGGR